MLSLLRNSSIALLLTISFAFAQTPGPLPIPSSLPPSGAAGGDLNGTYPNPTVTNGSHITGLPTAGLLNSAVTYAKIQNETASTLLGNPTGSAAAPSEITLGSTLNFSGTTLNCTSASASQYGCVEPDNTTIEVSGGKLAAIGAAATSVNAAGATSGTTVTNGNAGAILYQVNSGGVNYLTSTGTFVYSGGTVGIGISTPHSTSALDVVGGIQNEVNLNGVFPSLNAGFGTYIGWNGSPSFDGETDFVNMFWNGSISSGFEFWNMNGAGTVNTSALLQIDKIGNIITRPTAALTDGSSAGASSNVLWLSSPANSSALGGTIANASNTSNTLGPQYIRWVPSGTGTANLGYDSIAADVFPPSNGIGNYVGGYFGAVGNANQFLWGLNPLVTVNNSGTGGTAHVIEADLNVVAGATPTNVWGVNVTGILNVSPVSGSFGIQVDATTGEWQEGLRIDKSALPLHIVEASTSPGNAIQYDGSGGGTFFSVGANGQVSSANGYQSRSGSSGSFSADAMNTFWTGSCVQLWVDTTNQGCVTVSSDERVKKNIVPLAAADGLPAILRLVPVSYLFKSDAKDQGIRFGVIAQQARDVLPNLVRNTGVITKSTPDGLLQFDYNSLFGSLIKADQQLAAIVFALIILQCATGLLIFRVRRKTIVLHRLGALQQ